ncbi:sensor domain-containing diguanylate cyclase [Halomonas sp. MM17-34]|uniref:sensor domain-containing diguanylate cyclase n=1 Tax=Halomonas sp. MM17-34 TaxID=2917742 RepID=UPI001EF5353C|nr:sensor domain-containing diguanylate cyclase [Halomonas sp. MM17-34]MCG7605743.1 sensor domain-containing diguanylate cyclase [Halomonas sp. MM17-34]
MSENKIHCSVEQDDQRLLALHRYQILDTPEEPAFDDIVEIASLICEAPVAVINFIDRNRQWFKSEKGLGVRETPLDVSICAHAILQPGLFVVPDTTLDPRFSNNPLVTGHPYLRFYAGALLVSSDGYPLGTLCVLDYTPRTLSEPQRFALQALANQVMAHMELMQAHREQAILIRDLKAMQSELSKYASTDPLTGLLNRRAFQQRLNQELALIKRGTHSAVLMLIDLDFFKEINDTFGHQIGDQVLMNFSKVCSDTFRQADVISRWGGEEFLIMLPMTTVDEARVVADRLHKILDATSILDVNGSSIYLSISVGVSALTDYSTVEDSLQRVDSLLYRAKNNGRNCTVTEC